MTRSKQTPLLTRPQKALRNRILRDTIERYKGGENRCISERGGGLLADHDGRSCALGFHLLRSVRDYIARLPEGSPSYLMFAHATAYNLPGIWRRYGDPHALHPGNLDRLLVKESRGLPPEFWRAIQCLHDNPFNWIRGKTGDAVRSKSISKEPYLRGRAPAKKE